MQRNSVNHSVPAPRSKLEADSVACDNDDFLVPRSWPVETMDPMKAEPHVGPSKTTDVTTSYVKKEASPSKDVPASSKDQETQTRT